MTKEKNNALNEALSKIEKQFGKGAIMKMGDMTKVSDIKSIPTGSIALDIALGVGGIPRGRVIELFGNEGGGKTTLALHIIAEAQKEGGSAAFIDAEHAMDPEYASRIGVDVKELLISQPNNGEEALEICETLIRSNAVDIIVIDSVASLVPKSEIEGEFGAAQMGVQARLMSQAMRKLTAIISKSKTCVIFINQIRDKIGVMFGNPEVTPGGRALKFYSSVRLDIRRIESIKKDGLVIGNRVKVKVVKNKVAPPFREAQFNIIFGVGISADSSLFDVAVEKGIIEKSGAWFSFGGERIGHGEEAVVVFLQGHPDIAKKIEEQVRIGPVNPMVQIIGPVQKIKKEDM